MRLWRLPDMTYPISSNVSICSDVKPTSPRRGMRCPCRANSAILDKLVRFHQCACFTDGVYQIVKYFHKTLVHWVMSLPTICEASEAKPRSHAQIVYPRSVPSRYPHLSPSPGLKLMPYALGSSSRATGGGAGPTGRLSSSCFRCFSSCSLIADLYLHSQSLHMAGMQVSRLRSTKPP